MKLMAIPLFAMLAVAIAACGSEGVDEGGETAGDEQLSVGEAEQAARVRESIVTYYSNSSKTVEVGYTEYYCEGSFTEGQVTSWRTTQWLNYCSNQTCCYVNGQCPEGCFACYWC